MKIASILRAGVLGLALASAAVPAQAASMSLGFGFGDGFMFGHKHRVRCVLEMTESQLRRAISAQGYRNIALNVANNQRIQVRATKGEWVYLLRVSTCTGAIIERQRLRHA
jgi:hypothetical protein